MESNSWGAPIHTQTKTIKVGDLSIGGGADLAVIAGPCVIESKDHVMKMAEQIVKVCEKLKMPLIFKASYDKANRTSIESYRGPGIEEGLKILEGVKNEFSLPILTDVHTEDQAKSAADVCDIIQIPAFLCRQTDFIVAAGKTGKAVNVKKGQFLAPWDIVNVVQKLEEAGCRDILITERGTSFGYGSLVTDFRSLQLMAEKTSYPVCFDGTHSVQQPGGLGKATGGNREHVPLLCRAACAVGTNALFLETHDDPDNALSDGPNMIPLKNLEAVLSSCIAISKTILAPL